MTLPVADRRPAESYLKLPAALQWNNNQLVQCSSATDKPHQSQREKRDGEKWEENVGTLLQALNASQLILDGNGCSCFGITHLYLDSSGVRF